MTTTKCCGYCNNSFETDYKQNHRKTKYCSSVCAYEVQKLKINKAQKHKYKTNSEYRKKRNLYGRKWYSIESNKEKHKKYSNEYYNLHRQKYLEYGKKYREQKRQQWIDGNS